LHDDKNQGRIDDELLGKYSNEIFDILQNQRRIEEEGETSDSSASKRLKSDLFFQKSVMNLYAKQKKLLSDGVQGPDESPTTKNNEVSQSL